MDHCHELRRRFSSVLNDSGGISMSRGLGEDPYSRTTLARAPAPLAISRPFLPGSWHTPQHPREPGWQDGRHESGTMN